MTMYDDITINDDNLKSLESAIGKEKAQSYLNRFLQEFSEKIEEIDIAFQKSEYTKLQHLTHTYASSAATFGATTLYDICRHIEDMCANGSHQTLQDDLDILKKVGQQSCDQLKAYY